MWSPALQDICEPMHTGPDMHKYHQIGSPRLPNLAILPPRGAAQCCFGCSWANARPKLPGMKVPACRDNMLTRVVTICDTIKVLDRVCNPHLLIFWQCLVRHCWGAALLAATLCVSSSTKPSSVPWLAIKAATMPILFSSSLMLDSMPPSGLKLSSDVLLSVSSSCSISAL